MNRRKARILAEKVSNETLEIMFKNAKKGIKDWKKVSNVNKGATKGYSWNLFAHRFDVNQEHHILAKTNMIREFGEYLPKNFLQDNLPKNQKSNSIELMHQQPKFNNE